MQGENFIRFVVGPILIVGIYALTTTLMGLPFEWMTVGLVVIAYVAYSYFKHVRR